MNQFPDPTFGREANLWKETVGIDDPNLDDGQTLAEMLDGQPRERIQFMCREALRTGHGLMEIAYAHMLLTMSREPHESQS